MHAKNSHTRQTCNGIIDLDLDLHCQSGEIHNLWKVSVGPEEVSNTHELSPKAHALILWRMSEYECSISTV